VMSSFELSSRDAFAIQTALNETFSADIHLRFETSSSVIGGIELSVGGERLSWTITDYLKTLDEKVAALLSTDGISGSSPADTTPDRSSTLAFAQPAPLTSGPNQAFPAAAA